MQAQLASIEQQREVGHGVFAVVVKDACALGGGGDVDAVAGEGVKALVGDVMGSTGVAGAS